MNHLISIINRIFPSETIKESKFGYTHIYIAKSKFLYKRNLEGLKLISGFYDSPVKKLFAYLSILFPIPLSGVYYLNFTLSEIVFIKVGKSARVKIFYKNRIENYSINESDYTFTKDLCYRKMLRQSNVSPEVFEVRNGFFSEKRLKSTSIDCVQSLDNIFSSLFEFYNQFHKLDIGGKEYIISLCNSNKIEFDELNLQVGEIPENMSLVRSHGDFWIGNIIKSKEKLFLIDFEFTAYRSSFFDAFYFQDTSKIEFSKLKPYLPQKYFVFYQVIFLLERMMLLNYLQSKDYGNHSNRILLIIKALTNSGIDTLRKNSAF